MTQLYPYQANVIDALYRAIDSEKKKHPLLTAPTGSGKTVMLSAVVQAEIAVGGTVLIISHRREITRQTINKLNAVGIDPGVIQAGWPPRPEQPVQIASIQTLVSRALKGCSVDFPPATLVVIDEAHHVRAQTYMKVVEKYPNAVVLGLTATPCRADGYGLGVVFDSLIEGPQTAELIHLGFLVPTIVYAPSGPDLKGVRVQAGDYNLKQLGERVNTDVLVGDIVTHWHRHAEGRPTVAFATSVAHSIHIKDEFVKAGVPAEHLDGTTPAEDRDAMLDRLASGETKVLSNCATLTEGLDSPTVSCLILARPTKSLGLFKQMVGRGLRTAPGKTNCIVLDHSGAVHQHGLPDDDIQWTLETDRKAINLKQQLRSTIATSRLCNCPKCDALRTAGEGCRVCGWEPTRRGEAVDVIDGDLALVDRQRHAQAGLPTDSDMRFWYGAIRFIGEERARLRPFNVKGFSYWKFKEKFNREPPWKPWNAPPAVPPSAEVRAWVRSRDIAYAKSKGRAA